MRTLGFRTHVLLALAAAVGLVGALSRPWYAAAPPPVDDANASIGDINGPLNGFFSGLERWVTATNGATGWVALDAVAIAAAAMAGIAALGALVSLQPRLQRLGREALRYGSWFALGIVAWRLLDPPGANDATELRYGAFVALGCALVLASCSAEVSNAPLRGRRKPGPYIAPPAPIIPVYDTSGSSAPPGP